MQIVRKEENVESIYEIVYDKKQIEKLIDEIIENCSIRKIERHTIEANGEKDFLREAKSRFFWKKIPVYENISNIKQEPVNDPFDYWRHGDPVPYSFDSNTLNVPMLVQFLINLLEEKDINYDWFIERKELSYKKEQLQELQQLDSKINEISNFDTETKIRMLQELSRTAKYINNLPDFDLEKLENYYKEAESLIKLELIQQTIKYQRKK